MSKKDTKDRGVKKPTDYAKKYKELAKKSKSPEVKQHYLKATEYWKNR
jgi:hypothetical protein